MSICRRPHSLLQSIPGGLLFCVPISVIFIVHACIEVFCYEIAFLVPPLLRKGSLGHICFLGVYSCYVRVDVPETIQDLHPDINLLADYFVVQGIEFLHSISQGYDF